MIAGGICINVSHRTCRRLADAVIGQMKVDARKLRNEFETSARLSPEVGENKRSKKWRAQGDDFRTFLNEFVGGLTQFGLPAQLHFTIQAV